MNARFSWLRRDRPLSIAHRGAAAYAPDNTLEAFRLASQIGADMWEVDCRLTADGHVIAYHDEALSDGRKVADTALADILALTKAENRPAPLFDEVLDEAARLGAGIYADIKDIGATLLILYLLEKHNIDQAIIGAFDPTSARLLEEAGSPYPRSVLVPLGAEPFSYAAGADVIHLCWERMERPQDTLTDELFERAAANGQHIAIWHEEDPDRMAAIREHPVIGICSDRPELVNQPGRNLQFKTVCHRGASKIAPENTLPAMECALAAGFDYVECDLHQSADGEIVIHHDVTLERTTSGRGAITALRAEQLRQLDAGSWFRPHFTGTQIPLLSEVLDCVRRYDGGAYLELKSAPPEPVWHAVCGAGLEERVFFWSFDHRALERLRDIAPTARIMARRQDYSSVAEALGHLAPAIVEFTLQDLAEGGSSEEFAAVRAAGAEVMIAAMAGDRETLARVLAARPDIANVNHPFDLARLSRE